MSIPLRVLLIEDSEDDAILLLRILKQNGYEVTHERVHNATGLKEALSRTPGWDVVISDYSMPNFDGLAALKILRESGQDLPFIVVSGTIGEETAVQTMLGGAHDYLMKDNLARLVPAVQREIQEASVRRARQEAEEALRISEQRYQMATSAGKVAVWEWKSGSGGLHVAPHFWALLGYSEGEVESSPEALLTLIHPDDRDRLLTSLKKAQQAAGGHIETIEHRIIHRDGSIRWFATRCMLVEEGEGASRRLIGASTDITDIHTLLVSLQHRDAMLRAVNVAAERLLNSTDVIADTPDLLMMLGEATNVDRVVVFRNHLADDGSTLCSLVAESTRPGVLSYLNNPHFQNVNLTARPGFSSLLATWRSGQPFYGLTRDLPDDVQSLTSIWGVQALVVMPIFVNDSWWGTINFHRCESDTDWQPMEIEVLQTASNMIGAALERQQAQEALAQRQHELESLLDNSRQLLGTLDLDELLQMISQRTVSLLNGDEVVIFQLESAHNRLIPIMILGNFPEAMPRDGIRVGEGITGHAVAENRPILANHARSDPRALIWEEPDDSEIEHLMATPLVAHGQIIGAMLVNRLSSQPFTEENLTLFTGLAQQAAIAIHNAKLYQEMEAYSKSLAAAVEDRTSELRRTKERVEAILNSSPDAILLLQRGGAITAGNPAFQEMFSLEIDDAYGRTPADLVEPAHQQSVRHALAAAAGGQVQRLEVIAQRGDGSTFDAGLALAPIREGESIGGIVCSVRDISPLKEAQRVRDDFVSNVSHELRTPITSIKLHQELLERNPAKQAVYMERLRRETDRLARIIEDLLMLSRLDQQQMVLAQEPVDLNALASHYGIDRTPLAEERQLSLSVTLEDNLPPARGDLGLLGQVLSALLTNSFSYTPAGGQVTVRTHSRQEDGQVWVGFSVSDTGPGISADEQAQLFKRFFRGKSGHNTGAPGTGLGLAIAHEIIERHHGRIEVYSPGVPGQGATFSIWLPAAE